MLQLVNYCYRNISVEIKLDLSVITGARLALCGASGVGKTTVLNLMAGLLSPDQGDIQWLGASLLTQSYRQRPIAVLSQANNVFEHLSVADNIKLGQYSVTSATRHRFWDDLYPVVEAFKLTPYLQYKVSQLSGGQKQRVALIRLLSQRQQLWLMDEPFNGLDQGMKAIIQKSLIDWQQKLQATIIFTSHHHDEIEQFATDIRHLQTINNLVQIQS